LPESNPGSRLPAFFEVGAAATNVHRTIAIVQARMGSKRFPGKSLQPFCGRTVLGVLLERLKRCRNIDRLIVATSIEPKDTVIANLAESYGVAHVRGSEVDVLGRFVQVVDEHPAETVVRVCADSPLTDPAQIDALVTYFAQTRCDYAYNNYSECGLPGGLGGEILSVKTLLLLNQRAGTPADREHVTSFLWTHRDEFQIRTPPSPLPSGYPVVDLDIDCEDDLRLLQQLCNLLPVGRCPFWSTQEIVETLQEQQSSILPRGRLEMKAELTLSKTASATSARGDQLDS
jgi:spore coat polysaccharide biosynthesis protein SpsF